MEKNRNAMDDQIPSLSALDCVTIARMPMHERIIDRLADLLFDADEVLGMLDADDATALRWIAPQVRSMYDQINDLMKQLTD